MTTTKRIFSIGQFFVCWTQMKQTQIMKHKQLRKGCLKRNLFIVEKTRRPIKRSKEEEEEGEEILSRVSSSNSNSTAAAAAVAGQIMTNNSSTHQKSSSMLAFVSLVIILMVIVRVRQNSLTMADARLIHIYHKYRPTTDNNDNQQQLTNLSLTPQPSTIFEQLIGAGEQQTINQGGNQYQTSGDQNDEVLQAEYRSPMKRIMELIGQHAPVIVVSSSSSPSSSSLSSSSSSSPAAASSADSTTTDSKQSLTRPITQDSLTNLNYPNQQAVDQQRGISNGIDMTNTLNNNVDTSSSQPTHWTLFDPSQQPLIAAAQQQQLIQSTIPFENQQYFFAPSQLTEHTIGNQQQFTVLPTNNLGFNPSAANGYQHHQPMNTLPAFANQNSLSQSNEEQRLQQQASQLGVHSFNDRVQPIFLSSYVPEIQVQDKQQPFFNPAFAQLMEQQQQRPNSIQQQIQQQIQPNVLVQQQQQQQQQLPQVINQQQQQHGGGGLTKQKSQAPIDSSQVEENDSADDGGNDESNSIDNNGGDLEEPQSSSGAKSKRSQLKDEDDGSGSGSIKYEDKFDSDKDEQPKISTTTTNNNNQISDSQQTDSNTVINGLVNVGLNDDCLQCICRASSGCDHLLRCITRGSEEKYCGPFQLTEEYWNLAGSPGDAANNFLSFEDCANEADCAVETVTNYMKKYHKDCDGDENITCMDYARLHRLKPTECGDTEKLTNDFDAYWAKFQRCAEGYNKSRNGEDEDI